MTQYKSRMLTIFLTFFIVSTLHAANKLGMRNGRYCEIILSASLSQYKVYNTWGLNMCPENKWQAVTVEKVKQETKASRVHLNGPRYWVIDGFKNTNLINPTVTVIAGIPMREAGIVHLGLMDLLKLHKPYQNHEVNRESTWIYQAHKPVYELISPKGEVYVMQSYSIESHPQTLASLSNLGNTLHLPNGWHFKTGILKKTQTLATQNKKAFVIQDDFYNTYQLANHDFLP